MNQFRLANVVVAIAALFSSFCALAMEVVAKSDGVNVVGKPSPEGGKLGTLARGEKVRVESRVGMFYAVEWKGQKAFVKVSETEAIAVNGEVKKALKHSVSNKKVDTKSGRQRTNAVMGIRGLDDKEDITANGGKANSELTQKMENRQVNPKGVSEIENAVNEELEQKSQAK